MVWFNKNNLEDRIKDTILDCDYNVIPVKQIYQCKLTGVEVVESKQGLYIISPIGYVRMEKRIK